MNVHYLYICGRERADWEGSVWKAGRLYGIGRGEVAGSVDFEKIRSRKYVSLERFLWRTGRSGFHIVGNVILAQADRKNREEKILLTAQTLLYIRYINHNFDIEGRWSTHGNEESSEETREEGGQEEEVVAP